MFSHTVIHVVPTVLTQAEEMKFYYSNFMRRKSLSSVEIIKISQGLATTSDIILLTLSKTRKEKKKHKRITNAKGKGKYMVKLYYVFLLLCSSLWLKKRRMEPLYSNL